MTDLALLTAADARALTDRIKVGVEAIWELIKQAYTERAWDALGYESWDDYCTREFGTSRLRLPREERAEVVASLRESGLSTRAIASATGLARNTVLADLRGRDEVAQIEPPAEPEPVDAEVAAPEPDEIGDCSRCGFAFNLTALYEAENGYECESCVELAPGEEPAPATPLEPELPPLPENYMNLPPQPAPAPKPITGTDGKTYSPKPSVPQQPKRKPLPETFDRAKQDLRSVVERVTRLMADDRLEKNKDQIVGANLSDLIRARDALTRVIQHLEG